LLSNIVGMVTSLARLPTSPSEPKLNRRCIPVASDW